MVEEPLTQTATLAILRSRPLIYVDDVGNPIGHDDDMHHLRRSLRLDDGDPIAVSDGRGSWRLARFGQVVEPEGPIRETKKAPYALTVGFVPVKGGRTEQMIQKLTELGIDRMIPLFSTRSVVRWNSDRAARNHERGQKVVREAGMQSRRVRLPELMAPLPLADFAAVESPLALCEPGADLLDSEARTVLVGPEGGFDAAEVSLGRPVGLPGGVLRAETAVSVAGALMTAHRFVIESAT